MVYASASKCAIYFGLMLPKGRSRCWRSYQDANNNPVWSGNVVAYTTNVQDTITPVATINFCPGFFEVPTCQAVIDTYGSQPVAALRLDLLKYICQGQYRHHNRREKL